MGLSFLTGFRKFTYGLIFLTISLILLMFEIVDGADWIKYNKEVAVAFMATNVGEHIIQVAKTWVNDRLLNSAEKAKRP